MSKSKRRRGISQTIKRRAKECPNGVWAKFWDSLDTKCHYCEGEMDIETMENPLGRENRINRRTFDHIVCRIGGGKNDPSNLIACCDICNVLKGEREYLEFALFAHFNLRPLRQEDVSDHISFKERAENLCIRIIGKEKKSNIQGKPKNGSNNQKERSQVTPNVNRKLPEFAPEEQARFEERLPWARTGINGPKN